jgi:alpha-ketoglutarate-dependent taurine dioxygenase
MPNCAVCSAFFEELKMSYTEAQKPTLKKFAAAQRKPVAVTQEQLVKESYLADGAPLPLVLQPAMADLDLPVWAAAERAYLEAQLLKHGALLFRGFALPTVSEFERFAQALCPQLFGEYGDLPREGVSGKVYQSTPYPADQAILFHNESSHLHRWPLRIWFYCVQAALEGGETPLVDCREVYRQLDPHLRQRFEERGLLYLRNYTDGLDVSWQHFFRTTDRAAVEAYCRAAGIEYEWKRDGGLRTRRRCQAVARHPATGEATFFNQVALHHISCLAPAVRESLQAVFAEEDLPRHVYYGDGAPIEDAVITEVRELCDQLAVRFRWQEGDVALLDNMLVAHSRAPFTGPRKIVVAMGEMMESRNAECGMRNAECGMRNAVVDYA